MIAARERIEQVEGRGISMRQRQECKDFSTFAEEEIFVSINEISHKAAMGDQHALGESRGAAGIDDGGDIFSITNIFELKVISSKVMQVFMLLERSDVFEVLILPIAKQFEIFQGIDTLELTHSIAV